MQQQIHLHQHVGQRLGLLTEQGVLLQYPTLVRRADLRRDVVIGLNQKAACATGWVEHRLTQARVGNLHHEAHHRARGVELTGIASGIAHFAQHRLVQVREGVDFLARAEVDTVDFVDDIAQQIPADHAVLHALEHVRDDFALAALFSVAGQAAQVGKQTLADRAIDTDGRFLADERQQFITGDTVITGGPVAPAVRGFNDGLVALTVEFSLFLMDRFKVVEKLEEHHPGEQGQTIHVAIEALVLAQDLAGASDQGR